jgi:hypothetical protein
MLVINMRSPEPFGSLESAFQRSFGLRQGRKFGRWIKRTSCGGFSAGFQDWCYRLPSGFNFYVNTTRQIQLGQRVYRTGRGGVNIQQALVGCQLELLTALLVNVRGTQHRKDLLFGRQRNRSCYYRTGTTHRFYDLLSRLVHQIVIV